jgi:hypothetical protein
MTSCNPAYFQQEHMLFYTPTPVTVVLFLMRYMTTSNILWEQMVLAAALTPRHPPNLHTHTHAFCSSQTMFLKLCSNPSKDSSRCHTTFLLLPLCFMHCPNYYITPTHNFFWFSFPAFCTFLDRCYVNDL